jgi:hypothetical protein
MEDSLDPTVPSSIGALLAEEWTIDPFSVLPSFLEMVMIEGASSSTRKALVTGMEALQRQLGSYLDVHRSDETRVSLLDFKFISFCCAELARAAKSVMQRYGPELRCLAIYLLERQCLHSKACATLSESIYGVRRAKLSGTGENSNSHQRKVEPLSQGDKTRLALLLAFGPYFREKMHMLYQKWRLYPSMTLRNKRRRNFVAIYPFLRMSLDGVNVLCQWRFLLGSSVFYDPYSLLLNQVVRRVTQEDVNSRPSGSSNSDPDNSPPNSILPPAFDEAKYKSTGQKVAVYLLATSFAVSWMTQIRSEWQRYTRERQNSQESSSSAVSCVIPPPPQSSGVNVPKELCPLCQRPRIQPTASTSGHVFCLSCLLPFVKEHGRCPVTGVDCPESRIVRLYEPHQDLQVND